MVPLLLRPLVFTWMNVFALQANLWEKSSVVGEVVPPLPAASVEGTLSAAGSSMLGCVFVQARLSPSAELECQLEERASMLNGRLRIPCGNGFVTLPAMAGVGL